LTSLGAAYLAGLAVGYWKSGREIKKYWRKDRIFKPKMSRKKASNLYGGWSEAVKRTLSGS
ncbi:MAG: glycerol kinase, partial [Candidatus Omnitrophota bacterium]